MSPRGFKNKLTPEQMAQLREWYEATGKNNKAIYRQKDLTELVLKHFNISLARSSISRMASRHKWKKTHRKGTKPQRTEAVDILYPEKIIEKHNINLTKEERDVDLAIKDLSVANAIRDLTGVIIKHIERYMTGVNVLSLAAVKAMVKELNYHKMCIDNIDRLLREGKTLRSVEVRAWRKEALSTKVLLEMARLGQLVAGKEVTLAITNTSTNLYTDKERVVVEFGESAGRYPEPPLMEEQMSLVAEEAGGD